MDNTAEIKTTIEVSSSTRDEIKNEMKKADTYDSFLQVLVKLARKFPHEVEKMRGSN